MPKLNQAQEPLPPFLQAAIKRRPAMRAEDVYKLIYQGSLGIGHLLGNHREARLYLIAELENLDLAGKGREPLIEDVSPGGAMIRVNLRPFKRRGLSASQLFDVMVRSARATGTPRAAFLRRWRTCIRLAEAGLLPLDRSSVAALDRELRRRGYPAIHHSPSYVRHYRPAYRVARRDCFVTSFGTPTATAAWP
jgi:hypothetical protein